MAIILRSTMYDIIDNLRHKIFDYEIEDLNDDVYYKGDKIQLAQVFIDYDGVPTAPTGTPKMTIYDPARTARITSATMTTTGITGEYAYNFAIPTTIPIIGDWRYESTATVDGVARKYSKEFRVLEKQRLWTDERLQSILDRHRRRIVREQMSHNVTYLIYMSAFDNLEEAQIYDGSSDGATLISSSTYSANLDIGEFTFTSAQDMTYYMDGITYDLYSSACELLRELRVDPSRARQWSRGSVSHTGYDLGEIIKDYMRQSSKGISIGRVRRVYEN